MSGSFECFKQDWGHTAGPAELDEHEAVRGKHHFETGANKTTMMTAACRVLFNMTKHQNQSRKLKTTETHIQQNQILVVDMSCSFCIFIFDQFKCSIIKAAEDEG